MVPHRLALASLLCWGLQVCVGRWFHDNRGKKAHPHTFLAFCGDDGNAGGIYPVECTFNKDVNTVGKPLTWPVHVDGFTYLTYPKCSAALPSSYSSDVTTWTNCAAGAYVSETFDAVVDAARNPLHWPLGNAGLPGGTINFYQPVVAPIGEIESNPHHLVWPAGRTGASAVVTATNLMRANAKELSKRATNNPQGSPELKHLSSNWDPLTINIYDRIEIRDGQLLATVYDRKYTPAECARLCNKITQFRRNSCIAFSRKWFKTDKAEHSDSCGRDNDVGVKGGLTSGYGGGASWTTDMTNPHTTGGKNQPRSPKTYTYPAQCVFFGKVKDPDNSASNDPANLVNLCTTAEDWLLDSTGVPWPQGTSYATVFADKTSCQYRHRNDVKVATTNWKAKTRSWRMISPSGLGVRAYSPSLDPSQAEGPSGTARWPADTPSGSSDPVQEGRRLQEELNGTRVGHEFILPNGTHFWAWE